MVNKARLVWSRRYLLLQLLLLALQVLDAFVLPLVLLPHLLDGLLPLFSVLLEVHHLGLQLLLPLESFVELAPTFVTKLILTLLSLAFFLVPRGLQVLLSLPPVLPDGHLQLLLDRRLHDGLIVLPVCLLDLALVVLARAAWDLLGALRVLEHLMLLD